MPRNNFNFSGLTEEQIDDILELKADLEADAIWSREEQQKFQKNNGSQPDARPQENQ
jgi:hypothetical protein